jgi:hypothetical protein
MVYELNNVSWRCFGPHDNVRSALVRAIKCIGRRDRGLVPKYVHFDRRITSMARTTSSACRTLLVLVTGHLMQLNSLNAQSGPAASPKACARESRLIPLETVRDTITGLGVALEEPSATRKGADILITGNPTSVWLVGSGDTKVVLRNLAGTTIDPPPESHNGVRPQIAAVGDTLYFLWGEPARPAMVLEGGRRAWPPPIKAVWLSTRIGDVSWSKPIPLAQAVEGVSWGASHATVSRGPKATLHLLLLAAGQSMKARLVYVRMANAIATVSEQLLEGPVAYARMSWSGSRAITVFVAPVTGSTKDVNSVFVSRWDSASSEWRAPQLVSRSGSRGAVAPRVIATPDGVFHLVWGQSLDDGLSSEVLRHIQSTDSGNSWSQPSDLRAPGVHPDEIIPIGKRGFGVLYVGWETATPRLMVACWLEKWKAPRRMLADSAVFAPRLISGSSNGLIARRHLFAPVSGHENILVLIP